MGALDGMGERAKEQAEKIAEEQKEKAEKTASEEES